jgi:hypothetical protein
MIIDIMQPNFDTPICLITASESPLIKKIVKNKKGEVQQEPPKKEDTSQHALDHYALPLKKQKMETMRKNPRFSIRNLFIIRRRIRSRPSL